MIKNWLCALLLVFAANSPAWAATRAENRAFEAAAKAFHDQFWERAEAEFGDFVRKFPEAEQRANAVLLQAQARCHLKNYRGAIELLEGGQAGAGSLADQYLFWLGEAQYQSASYPAAVAAFRKLGSDFPVSDLRLKASVKEASAWANLKEWGRVEELLSQPAGVFQQLSQSAPASEPVALGILLLAEARLTRSNFNAAAEVLRKLDPRALKPELAWRGEFLLCQALLGADHPDLALQSASNLVALASATAQPALQAESRALQARALEELGQLENASATYALNLTTNAPVEVQRQALLKVGELALVRGRLAEAAQALATFLQRHPESPACDMALLSLGELQLRQHPVPATGAVTNASQTNLLQQAQTNFDALIERFPKSPLLGRAQLDRGWCFSLTTNLADSASAFAAAATLLPPSFDQAVARFKLAEVQYQQGQQAAAISNYSAVVALGGMMPEVRTNLCQPALYQIVRASTETTNHAAATEAIGRLLDWFPDGHLTESGLLVAGQGLARQGDPAGARRIFESFVNQFTNSARGDQVRLAIGRTYELQQDWPQAARAYQALLSVPATTAERPQAEFALAFANYQARLETNALVQFTNFVARYPTNDLAPRAEWWIADYYFRNGDFQSAETHYQLLFQTWPASELAPEARMMAGRAAMARQSWPDAIGYFTNLTSNPSLSNLWTQAMFAYGDALRRSESAETNNPANLEEAVKIFRKIHDRNTTNAVAARAWGEIGNCYVQLAAQDPNQYTNAQNAFRQVVEAPWADVPSRSQASVGLGLVAEKLAALETGEAQRRRLTVALNHYLDVLYENNLREGERCDAFWIKRAGLDAARLVEALGEWKQAVRIYERLQTLLPVLGPELDKRIARANEQLKTTPR